MHICTSSEKAPVLSSACSKWEGAAQMVYETSHKKDSSVDSNEFEFIFAWETSPVSDFSLSSPQSLVKRNWTVVPLELPFSIGRRRRSATSSAALCSGCWPVHCSVVVNGSLRIRKGAGFLWPLSMSWAVKERNCVTRRRGSRSAWGRDLTLGRIYFYRGTKWQG